jgi:hypothetical protein
MSSARSLATHLRRYPGWYALAAVWLVAMVSLPIVRGTALADVFTGGQPSSPETAAPAAGAPDLGAGGGQAPAFTPGPDGELGTADDLPVEVTTPESEENEPSPLDIVPPELLDAIFDALPPVAFPALPAEIEPIANAVAPVAATGCSGLGLAGVVVAVAAQTVDGVPFDRILPYLAPASTACASFPIPKVHTVCAFDEPLIIDLGGLTNTPPLLGLGIDQLRAFEALMASQFGIAVPSIADSLSESLDCRLVS